MYHISNPIINVFCSEIPSIKIKSIFLNITYIKDNNLHDCTFSCTWQIFCLSGYCSSSVIKHVSDITTPYILTMFYQYTINSNGDSVIMCQIAYSTSHLSVLDVYHSVMRSLSLTWAHIIRSDLYLLILK